MEDLQPATEYTIRLSSNNIYGRSDGVSITQMTRPGMYYLCSPLVKLLY